MVEDNSGNHDVRLKTCSLEDLNNVCRVTLMITDNDDDDNYYFLSKSFVFRTRTNNFY